MTFSSGKNGNDSWKLTVTARSGEMRVAPVWQALVQSGARAKGMIAHHDEKHHIDEIVLVIEPNAAGVRDAILFRLKTQTWITQLSIDDSRGSTQHI